MVLYMEVTMDKYELPVRVCDTVKELSRLSGATENSISSCISHSRKGDYKRSRFVKVEI